ncbi:unnamed protein product [Paramecium primaurelia]|uniref:Uncharacterized protein n=1 Tax=Paramecium primaurelia TaxID=5886 RepID=A0A8S1KFJ8_PARPR|nr:unnamed protein product [Paramecium primaurelia]
MSVATLQNHMKESYNQIKNPPKYFEGFLRRFCGTSSPQSKQKNKRRSYQIQAKHYSTLIHQAQHIEISDQRTFQLDQRSKQIMGFQRCFFQVFEILVSNMIKYRMNICEESKKKLR